MGRDGGSNPPSSIYILLFLLVVSSALAYDAETTIELNESNSPITGTTSFDLNFLQNATLTLTQQQRNDHINLTFPASLTMEADTITINISYVVGSFIPVESIEYINTSINITNNANNFSTYYGLLFKINRITPPSIIINSTEQIATMLTGYNATISQDLLGVPSEALFRIQSPINVLVNFTLCEEWLTCPESFITTSTTSEFKIKYTIPKNTSLGTYNQHFYATIGNQTRVGTLQFTIVPISLSLTPFVFGEDCYEEVNGVRVITEACIQKYEESLRREREEALRLSLIRENLTRIQNVTIEKLVMVGSIDEQLKKLYDDGQTRLLSVEQESQQRQQKIDELMLEMIHLESLLSLEQNKTIEQNLTYQSLLQEQQNSSRRIVYYIIGIVGIILLVGIYLKVHYNMNMQEAW